MPESISEKKPWKSRSIGCHPSDVKAHNEELKRKGVQNAHIGPDGHAVAHCRKGRNELLKAYGMIDRDGGYGDYTGR